MNGDGGFTFCFSFNSTQKYKTKKGFSSIKSADYLNLYIYIYIEREREREKCSTDRGRGHFGDFEIVFFERAEKHGVDGGGDGGRGRGPCW